LRNGALKIRLTAAAVGAERTAAPKANVEADQTIQCGEQRPLIEASSCKAPSGSWRQFNPFGQARGWSRMPQFTRTVLSRGRVREVRSRQFVARLGGIMESQVRRKLGLIGMQPPYRYRRDFPYGLLEFCSEDARLITVRRTGPIE